jgi:hypothetical protein
MTGKQRKLKFRTDGYKKNFFEKDGYENMIKEYELDHTTSEGRLIKMFTILT